jgi:hypothetical protein
MACAHSGIPAFEGMPSFSSYSNIRLIDLYLDVVGCQAAVFEWAESYDTKDWQRLAECVTPTLHVCLPYFRDLLLQTAN